MTDLCVIRGLINRPYHATYRQEQSERESERIQTKTVVISIEEELRSMRIMEEELRNMRINDDEKLSLKNKKIYWEMIWKAEEERRSRWINDESFREKEMTRKAEEEEKLRISQWKTCDERKVLAELMYSKEEKDKERFEVLMKDRRDRLRWDLYRCSHLVEYPPITHHITASPFQIIDNSPVIITHQIQIWMTIEVRRSVQYWCPRVSPGTRDDDDVNLQIITSHQLRFLPPEEYNLQLDHVFTSGDDDAKIMFSIYNQLYAQCSAILSGGYKELEEVMKSILDSISEKKESVLKKKPSLLNIHVFISYFEHKYFQCAEDAYPAFASAGHPEDPYFIQFIGLHNERRSNAAATGSSTPNISNPILFLNY